VTRASVDAISASCALGGVDVGLAAIDGYGAVLASRQALSASRAFGLVNGVSQGAGGCDGKGGCCTLAVVGGHRYRGGLGRNAGRQAILGHSGY